MFIFSQHRATALLSLRPILVYLIPKVAVYSVQMFFSYHCNTVIHFCLVEKTRGVRLNLFYLKLWCRIHKYDACTVRISQLFSTKPPRLREPFGNQRNVIKLFVCVPRPFNNCHSVPQWNRTMLFQVPPTSLICASPRCRNKRRWWDSNQSTGTRVISLNILCFK